MMLTALALAATVPPERWVHVGGRAAAYEDYLDTESIQPAGNRVTAWTRRDSAPDRSVEWHELEFDCSGGTATILAYVRNQDGTISHSSARPHRGPSPIRPGSAEDRIFNRVCR